ncbi:unnamed protein product [Paramecium pentaurelia]|uniref:Uncharacterized protein n=1 Tax=Paramecium pentaurelia TaxID=43138 RepID=A0A8S1VAC1_9CILI|nr:unnamed protein product [Paramecium pentaurelia]
MDCNSGQYFQLQKLTTIMMECGQIDYYLRKHENRIGILHEGGDYFYLAYLENNEFQYDTLFEYLSKDQEENEGESSLQDNQSSSASVQTQKLLYCFCGKVFYLFICQQFGEIVQVELKTQKENNFKIKMQYLLDMRTQKNTDVLVLLYSKNTFEIRNTQTLDILIQLELTSFPIIEDLMIQNSIIVIQYYTNILHYCQIRPSKIHQLYILNGNSCKIYQRLLILQENSHRFKFYYNLSKPKLLRQVNLLEKNKSKYKFIQKQNQIFLKEKSSIFVKFSYYKWWVGSFQQSNLVNQYFDGQITSREAKEKVYILQYKSITLDQEQKQENIVDFCSPYHPVYDRYGWD